MSENTKIEWCDHTFNPWEGCEKVSPGCAHCYAEAMNHRWGKDNWGAGKARRRTSEANWKGPLKWNRELEVALNDPEIGDMVGRPRVFCASLADWIDDAVPIEWMADLLKLIHDTPNLDWLLLTKRPENFFRRVTEAQTTRGGIIDKARGYHELAVFAAWLEFWRTGAEVPPNVWIGTSVEDQQRADERIPELLKIPAQMRFLSVEPMLGPIDFLRSVPCGYYCSEEHGHVDHSLTSIHWAIFGGESGPKARPCNADWIRDGIAQCKAAGVAPFVKQLGSAPCCSCSVAVGSFSANCCEHFPLPIRDKKGGDMSEWPEDLRVREFPEVRR